MERRTLSFATRDFVAWHPRIFIISRIWPRSIILRRHSPYREFRRRTFGMAKKKKGKKKKR